MPYDPHSLAARTQRARRAAAWNDTRADRGPASTLAALREVQAEILRMKEAQESSIRREGPGLPSKRRPSVTHPCARCGQTQPGGQTDTDLKTYMALNPTARLHQRADGIVRAHTQTCDAIPQKPATFDPPPLHGNDAVGARTVAANAGLALDHRQGPTPRLDRLLQRGWFAPGFQDAVPQPQEPYNGCIFPKK